MDQVYDKPGIYYFDGRIRCPFAGIGTRSDFQSNRLVLDAFTEVTIDRKARTISVLNERFYETKEIVADLTFLAEGTTRSGAKTEFELHLKIFKKGDTFSTDFHRHMRTPERLASANFEPFEIVASDGVSTRVLTNETKSQQLCTKPSWGLLLVKAMMATRDHLDDITQDPSKPGFKLADMSMGFGLQKLGWMMVRAKLESLEDCSALLETRSIPALLTGGAWELTITPFTTQVLGDVVKRDLFLFGLADHPLLSDVSNSGLAPGQTLAFRFDRGTGSVGLDGEFEDLPEALDIARDYLEFHMLGGLLVEHASKRFEEVLR